MLPGQKIDISLPPETLEAFGYQGDARFVSFRWSYGEFWYDNSQRAGTGNHWTFQSYAHHRAVAPLLNEHDLGGAYREAPFIMLIDRERNRATIAPIAEAREFLRGQWPPPQQLTPEQREELRREAERLADDWLNQPFDFAKMDEQSGRVGRLMRWLNMCPSAPERGRK